MHRVSLTRKTGPSNFLPQPTSTVRGLSILGQSPAHTGWQLPGAEPFTPWAAVPRHRVSHFPGPSPSTWLLRPEFSVPGAKCRTSSALRQMTLMI